MRPVINQNFQNALSQLNPEQHTAVETIEGPVLVIAGPGTGKTQIIAARIGQILTETDALPENILCLTYTDAGTIAMRKRLNEFIGAEAYRAGIFTFHGFCNKVIQENPELFGNRDLEPLSELERIDILNEIVKKFPPSHPLGGWNEYSNQAKSLGDLFNTMKMENWSAQGIIYSIDNYLVELKSDPDMFYKRKQGKYNKGDFKIGKYLDKKKSLDRTKAAVETFEEYNERVLAAGRYDYDDMIKWVLERFESKEDDHLLLNYQEQYQYVLVDEYQDTNGSQNQILYSLLNFWDNPNVFVVGDDDQAIFRFQGASVANIFDFIQRYASCLQQVVLKNNYRSTPKILELAEYIINHNTERLSGPNGIEGVDKNLVASAPEWKSSVIKPQIVNYYNSMHEAVDIANQIEQIRAEGTDYSEIAVIYRMHKNAEDLADHCRKKNIPLKIKKKADLFESSFTLSLLEILKYVWAESQEAHSAEDRLFEILHYDFFGIPASKIASLAFDLRSARGKKALWREHLKTISQNHKPELFESDDSQTIRHIQEALKFLEDLITAVFNKPLQQLFEQLVGSAKVLGYVMRSEQRHDLMQEVTSLFQFIKDETAKQPKLSVGGLLEYVSLMQSGGLPLEVVRSYYAEDGVSFLTAHSAKGLEFRYVFMVGCNTKNWEKKVIRKNFTFPPDIIPNAMADSTQELRRLFYVGVTRAKEQLQLSYASHDINGKELEESQFVSEAFNSGIPEVKSVHVSDEQLLDFQATLISETQTPRLKLIDTDRIKKMLDSYTLSVSHLNSYLKCPIQFYFEKLLRVPTAQNQYMAFGSSVHHALEMLFKEMVANEGRFHPINQVIRDYEWYMKRNRQSFTDHQFKHRLSEGKQILESYYTKYVNDWHKEVRSEENIHAVDLDGIIINGKIDKIEIFSNHVNVVDYKTGSYERAKRKKQFEPGNRSALNDADHPEISTGGDYWRQAVFYKILIDNWKKQNWKVASTEFDFVEPDEIRGEKIFTKKKVEIGEQDVEIVLKQIKLVHQGIMNLEFDKGCGDAQCKWCNFADSHYAVLPETELSELEYE